MSAIAIVLAIVSLGYILGIWQAIIHYLTKDRPPGPDL
jgi:hypothetical protein